jgi:hypothetical protein
MLPLKVMLEHLRDEVKSLKTLVGPEPNAQIKMK